MQGGAGRGLPDDVGVEVDEKGNHKGVQALRFVDEEPTSMCNYRLEIHHARCEGEDQGEGYR